MFICFAMTKNKAARILLNQTKKPLEDNFNFEEWMHQSHALIERFFGKDSEQYNRLHQPIISNHSNGEIRIKPNRNRQILFICAILKCCSDTIRLNGIYRKRRFPAYFNFALPALAILLLAAGVYFFFSESRKVKTIIQTKPSLIHVAPNQIKAIPVTSNFNISRRN